MRQEALPESKNLAAGPLNFPEVLASLSEPGIERMPPGPS
jgi:hypothetical protein